MPEQIRIDIGADQSVTATVYRSTAPQPAGISLILGHGAGAGQTHSFMVSFATALAARGIDTVTFNFAYMENGRRFLGYPLHPPGKPDRPRAKHLPDIKAPMLFVQGARDAFGTPDELRPILKTLTALAELHVVEAADHSFKVPKSAGLAQADVYKAIQDRIDKWLRNVAK